MRIHDAWRSLPDAERRAVAEELAALRATKGWPAPASAALARALNFRPHRIARLGDEALAQLLVRHLGRLHERDLTPLLKHLHVCGRTELLSAVYDALGVEHEGVDVTEARLAQPLDDAVALPGIEALVASGEQDPVRVAYCVGVMSCCTSVAWKPVVDRLCEWLRELDEERQPSGSGVGVIEKPGVALAGATGSLEPGVSGASGAVAAADSASEVSAAHAGAAEIGAVEPGADRDGAGLSASAAPTGAGDPGAGETGHDDVAAPLDTEDVGPGEHPEHVPRRPRAGLPVFSYLDRVLVDAAVASAMASEGSLERDELEALVEEVLSLNAKRKQSWFHRGFVDALQGEELHDRHSGGNAASRAWYLDGYLQGRMREDGSPDAVRQLIEVDLDDADRAALLSREGLAAGLDLAQVALLPLLHAGAVELVMPWLDAFLPAIAPRVLPAVLLWAKQTLVDADPEPVRRVLEAILRLQPGIEAANGPTPPRLLRDLRRRLAVCWRRAGRFPDARQAVEAMLADETESLGPGERGRLLGDRALILMGVKAIEDLALPGPDGREAFLEGIEHQRALLEQAVADGVAVPSALVALALPAVARSKMSDDGRRLAAERLRAALEVMNDDRDFWRRTGLLRRCRFYLTLLELREANQSIVSPAVSTLLQMLEEGDDLADDLPRDLVQEAIALAVMAEGRASAGVALHALKRRPHEMIRTLDLRRLAEQGKGSRQAVLDALGTAASQLTVDERWGAWRDLLRGSLAGGDRGLGAAERALDALEELAEQHGREVPFLALLDDEANWSPAWDLVDAFDARVRLLQHVGRHDEAVTLLHGMVHQAITAGDGTVVDLIERMESLGADSGSLVALRQRLEREQNGGPAATPAAPPAAPRHASVAVLFIGGNETQQAYEQSLQQWFAGSFPGCQLEFRFPGWSSNWGRTTDELENRLAECDAVVLMRFVRTGLGRAMRRAASELGKPWVPCGGHGRDGMRRAIGLAVETARRVG